MENGTNITPPEDAADWPSQLNRCQDLVAEGSFEALMDAAGKMVEQFPEKVQGYVFMADALWAANKPQEALAVLETLPSTAAQTPIVLGRKARWAISLKAPKDLMKAAQALITTAPENMQGWLYEAQAHRMLGAMDAALTVLDQAIDRFPKEVVPLLRKAAIARQGGRYKDLQNAGARLIERFPSEIDGLLAIADAEIGTGEFAAAVETLRRAHKNFGDVERVLLPMGRCLAQTGSDARELMDVANRLIQTAPGRVQGYLYSVTALEMRGQISEAEVVLDAVPASLAQRTEILNSRAKLATLRGDVSKLLEIAETFLQAHPDKVQGWIHRINAYEQCGQTEQSARALTAAMQRFSHELPLLRCKRTFARTHERWTELLSTGQAMARLFPAEADGPLACSEAYAKLGNLGAATDTLQQARTRFGSSEKILIPLGQLLIKYKEVEALAEVGAVLSESHPKNFNGPWFQAQALALAGDTAQAIEILRSADKAHNKNTQIKRSLANLLLNQESFSAAVLVAEEIIRATPEEPHGYIIRTNAFRRAKEFSNAYASAVEMIKIFSHVTNACISAIEAFNASGHGVDAEALINKLIENQTEHDKLWYLKGISQKKQGKYRQAIQSFEKSMVAAPGLIASYVEYGGLLQTLYPKRRELIKSFNSNFIKLFPKHASPYLLKGRYEYDVLCDFKSAYKTLTDGCRISPSDASILQLLLKMSVFLKKNDDIDYYTREMTILQELSKVDMAHFQCTPKFYTPKRERSSFRTLSETLHVKTSFRIGNLIEAEEHDFESEVVSGEKIIAILAILVPRPNLDVMFEIYKRLKKQGRNVRLFIDLRELHPDTTVDVDTGSEPVYGVWPGFFYSSNLFDCVITNDLSGLVAARMPAGCKLVFPLPHNTNIGPTHKKNLLAHYATYPFDKEDPNLDQLQALPGGSGDFICLMKNHYAKNEYLKAFVDSFPEREGGVIGFCPTTYRWLLQEKAENGLDLEEYDRRVVEMVGAVLERFPNFSFGYRPYWPNPEHWNITGRLVDEYGHNDRFFVDDEKNSKFILAVSDLMITDVSGACNSFSEIKGRYHHRFLPGIELTQPDMVSRFAQTYSSVESLIDGLSCQIEREDENMIGIGSDNFSGISNFIDDIDYILDGETNERWKYKVFDRVHKLDTSGNRWRERRCRGSLIL